MLRRIAIHLSLLAALALTLVAVPTFGDLAGTQYQAQPCHCDNDCPAPASQCGSSVSCLSVCHSAMTANIALRMAEPAGSGVTAMFRETIYFLAEGPPPIPPPNAVQRA